VRGRKVERLRESKVVPGRYAVIKAGDRVIEQIKGGRITNNLVYNDKHGIKSMRMGMAEIAPGEMIPEHNSSAEEIYYVLEGKGTIGVEGTNYEVGAGDIVYRAENIWHGPHINTGKNPLKLLYIVSQPMRPATAAEMWLREDKEAGKSVKSDSSKRHP